MATTKMTQQETGRQPKKPKVSHDDLRSVVDEYTSVFTDARGLSRKCRDYKDGKQWTAEQVKELKRRKQAPIVNNRIKAKHNGLLGLATLRDEAPKALPRNESDFDTKSADAVTDALTYVEDQTGFDDEYIEVCDNYFCEGIGGVEISVEPNPRGEMDVTVNHIPWGRLFFNVHSYKSNFSDSPDIGYAMWIDESIVRESFPDASEDAFTENESTLGGSDDLFKDKPEEAGWFVNGKNRRMLVSTHYFKKGDEWYWAIYTGSGFLLKPELSPWVDEFGRHICGIELVSAYTDSDNARHGELESSLDLQDEINHRRSKMLFLLSQRQTFGNKGAVPDPKKIKRELAKPDGHAEMGQGEFGKDFGILPTGDMAQGQFELLQEAKAEIDAQGFNAQLAGERQQGDLSGKAIGKLQQAGVTELNVLFRQLRGFRLRVYRQLWYRIRQFWTQEKWVRVTDDMKKPRWVGFNVQCKLGDILQETMRDDSLPYETQIGAAMTYNQLQKQNPQALEQVIEVRNKPAELDVDIIMDESADSLTASQEQLDAIITYGMQNGFSLIDLITISNIRRKDKLIDMLERRQQENAEAAAQSPQNQMVGAKVVESQANAKAKMATAQKTMVETQMMASQGVRYNG